MPFDIIDTNRYFKIINLVGLFNLLDQLNQYLLFLDFYQYFYYFVCFFFSKYSFTLGDSWDEFQYFVILCVIRIMSYTLCMKAHYFLIYESSCESIFLAQPLILVFFQIFLQVLNLYRK